MFLVIGSLLYCFWNYDKLSGGGFKATGGLNAIFNVQ